MKAKTNFPSVKSTEEMCSLDDEELDLNILGSFPLEEPCDMLSPESFLERSTWVPFNFLKKEWLEDESNEFELAEARFDLLGNLFTFRDSFCRLNLRRGASLSF